MRAFVIAAALSLALVAPAMAFHCPVDMAAIDAALAAGPSLSEADMAKVKELRAKGEAEHKAGKHAEAVESLAQAKAILGIE